MEIFWVITKLDYTMHFSVFSEGQGTKWRKFFGLLKFQIYIYIYILYIIPNLYSTFIMSRSQRPEYGTRHSTIQRCTHKYLFGVLEILDTFGGER